MKKILIKKTVFLLLLSGLCVWSLWLTGQSLYWSIAILVGWFFILFRDFRGPSVVTVMYHGVSDRPEEYPLPGLVCHIELFEKYLLLLKRSGFTCLNMDQFHAYKQGTFQLPGKSVVLHFDDGYLDNWVFAAPLLKKHGLCGTMFASKDFIEKSDRIRKRFDEVDYNPQAGRQLECLNYCSEKELQLMDQEGVLRVEAHAKSHSFYYSSDKIIGLYKQTEIDPFVEWNAANEAKPFWMTKLERKVPVGTPIFAYQPSCGNPKRYLPNPKAEAKIGAYVRRMILDKTKYEPTKVDEIMRQHPGRYETNEESQNRFKAELIEVKYWLEQLLNRPIHYLVWPHGGVSKPGLEMAAQYYRLFQIPNSGMINRPSDHKQHISRIGGLELKGDTWQQRIALWKIRAKMELAVGNYYWVVPFLGIKLLEKSGVAKRPNFHIPQQYIYNFNLIKP